MGILHLSPNSLPKIKPPGQSMLNVDACTDSAEQLAN